MSIVQGSLSQLQEVIATFGANEIPFSLRFFCKDIGFVFDVFTKDAINAKKLFPAFFDIGFDDRGNTIATAEFTSQQV